MPEILRPCGLDSAAMANGAAPKSSVSGRRANRSSARRSSGARVDWRLPAVAVMALVAVMIVGVGRAGKRSRGLVCWSGTGRRRTDAHSRGREPDLKLRARDVWTALESDRSGADSLGRLQLCGSGTRRAGGEGLRPSDRGRRMAVAPRPRFTEPRRDTRIRGSLRQGAGASWRPPLHRARKPGRVAPDGLSPDYPARSSATLRATEPFRPVWCIRASLGRVRRRVFR